MSLYPEPINTFIERIERLVKDHEGKHAILMWWQDRERLFDITLATKGFMEYRSIQTEKVADALNAFKNEAVRKVTRAIEGKEGS